MTTRSSSQPRPGRGKTASIGPRRGKTAAVEGWVQSRLGVVAGCVHRGQPVFYPIKFGLQRGRLVGQPLFFRSRIGGRCNRRRDTPRAAGAPAPPVAQSHSPGRTATPPQTPAKSARGPRISRLYGAAAISGAASCHGSHSHGACSVSSWHKFLLGLPW